MGAEGKASDKVKGRVAPQSRRVEAAPLFRPCVLDRRTAILKHRPFADSSDNPGRALTLVPQSRVREGQDSSAGAEERRGSSERDGPHLAQLSKHQGSLIGRPLQERSPHASGGAGRRRAGCAIAHVRFEAVRA